MAESTLHQQIADDINARVKWADRQAVWYRMRHDGIKRARKPYTGAPDMHFPLGDMVIEKLKPFYNQQLYASELLAELVSHREQTKEDTDQAAQWFDSHLKLKTNLLEEILFVIDAFLQGGSGFVRSFYNFREDAIEVENIDPLNLILPPTATHIQRAGRVVHVEVLTVEQYKQRKSYNQDGDFLKRITGRGLNSRPELKFDEKVRREGLTESSNSEEIIVWNVWEGRKDSWVMKTLSPLDTDLEIQPQLKNPFHHGECPISHYRRERKERGVYDSRGEMEKLGAFESYLNKLWNKKGEALDFFGTPLFTADQPGTEAKSLNFRPGEFVPGGIRRVDWGQPPMPFDQEMAQTRGIAEQRAGMPDYGMGGSNNLNEARTATEIEKLSELGGITTDLRGYTFRMDLRQHLRQLWSLAVQYKGDDLAYIFQEEYRTANRAVLHDAYHLDVGGSAESANKKLEIQKWNALYQQGKGDPYFDQLELRRGLVGAVNPRWIKRLVRDPQQQANSEAVDEMIRLPAIMEGAPIQPEPEQNHAIRAEVVFQKLQQLSATRAPLDPVAQQGLMKYLNARLMLWKQQDSKAATTWWRDKQAAMKAATEQQQQQAQPGGNMVPFSPPQPQAATGGAR